MALQQLVCWFNLLIILFCKGCHSQLPGESTIRLTGSGSTRCSGRVEIFYNNTWGTVSDYNWDLNDAEVVCRQLDCGSALEVPQSSKFGAGTGQVWLSGVSCSGNESSLTECQHTGWGNYYNYYGHSYDVGVICSGVMRLNGSGSTRCSGRVEVYHNNSWGTVCDDGWDLNDAEVVCRQISCGSALEVPPSAHFGAGTGKIWLDHVSCSGNESSLTECQHSGFGSNTCEHGQDAAVICSAVPIILTGSGSTRCSGRVEVYHNNIWGTVCDDGWDLNDAEVVCRQLNCGPALEVPQSAHFGAGTGQIWLDNVTCSGNESSLTECQHSGFGSNRCEHGQDAAIICSDLIRLAGSGSSRCSGRVEVYHDNVWGTVSDDNWVLNDAEVVCREINCGSALEATPSSKFGAGSGQVWLSYVSCSGNESSLTECQHTGWGNYYNYYYSLHSYDVGVICSGVIRLTGSGSTRCSGRVEVYHSNSWGTVCDDGWDLNDAEVVCRQINCGTALQAPQSTYFGAGTGHIWLDNLTCSGNESSLTECQHSGFGSNRCEHGQDAAVICSDLIRLAGSGSSRCSGRVEIFHNNVWGTVSDYKWDLNDAEVVCRQLNCGSALQAPRTAYFGAGTGQIWLSGVSCSGNESSLTECQQSGWGNSYYYYYYSYYDRHYYDAGVICSGPIRLTGSGSTRCSGRVEVYHNNSWGTVCDDGWDLNDAGVVCRQLNCGSALEVPQSAHFGAGTGQIWLDNVTCSGNESSLTECQHSGFGSNGCEHGQDAAVICSAVSIILTGSGSTRCSGRVEVYHNNSWGTVCDDGWDLSDAEVVCRQLNCGSALEVPKSAHFGAGTGQIWLDNVTCSGNESSLTECQHSGFGSNRCEHGQDAAVICSAVSIILTGSGSTRCSGRVEVYHNNSWGTVCDDGWDLNDAEVVCRQLNCGSALEVPQSAHFGAGTGQIWLDNVTCSGNESSLTECQHSGFGSNRCEHGQDAAVICSDLVRLAGSGSSRCSGRVEVYHDNVWGTVSDNNWVLNDAEVVCREINCGSALEATPSSKFGAGSGQVWLSGVSCSGNESSLTECQHTGWGNYYNYYYNLHSSDVGVICSGVIRLTGSGSTRCSGRVEVYHSNSWGTVCDDGWDLNDAEVVCRQINCGTALEVPKSSHFGAGTGQIWLGDVSCSGNESSLTECQHSGFGSNGCEHDQDAAVICSDLIRLAGSGSSRCSGRVEIFHNNVWGTVSDYKWDLNDAEVVCRQINCGSALQAPRTAYLGAGTGQIWLSDVSCSGNESSLTECQNSGWGNSYYYYYYYYYYSYYDRHYYDAGVICSGPIRLTGSGSSQCSGRVEVYHNNSWGTVCDDGWDLNDAGVVCRQLNCGSALEVPQSAHFGAGTGQIWLDNVTCSGNESSLTECQHSGFGSNRCEHGQDAAVICSDLVRLAGSGSSRCSGRVEVYHDNVWGTVSDNNWVLNDAEVVCKQINCGSALEATPSSKFGAGSGQVWLSGVSCSGNESSLTECQHTGWGNYYNYYYSLHSYDVGVICSGVIRLTGSGSTRCSGRVEVYHSNSWGTVCDDGWDLNDAEVVCRQINCGSALEVPPSAHFGAGTGQIWLGDVSCSGNESSLTECQHSGFGSNTCEHGQDAAVICSAVSIILTGSGSTRCSGRVEVYHNNSWGTVCDDGWDLNDAEVVCRQLNCGSALEVPQSAHFGAGTGQIWLDNVTCSGNESSLTECQHSGFGSNRCEHGQDAAVICSDLIRLAGSGSSRCSGRVEVYHDNVWGTVSDNNWVLNDAEVVCREINCGSALEATPSSKFGAGTGQVWLSDVSCSGNESSLTECQHTGWGNYYNYYYSLHSYDVGVMCSGVIRLTGSGLTRCSGRVEVYHSNSWGTVCDDGWDLNDAEVVCRQINCGSALEVPQSAHFGAGTGQIWLGDVSCSGNESSLTECQHSGFGSNTCEHGQDAAVICSDLIRLAGSGSSRCSGRVEIFHNNVWGTVSDYKWDLNDAEVVCRQLNCGSALQAPRTAYFGAGTGQIWLSGVSCSGNESSLSECQHTGWGNYYNSYYYNYYYYYYDRHYYDAGVICSGPIRLTGSGSSQCSGRVEVFHNNRWGTVCDDGWDLNDAGVVCRQLNCGSALEVPQSAHFGAGTGQIWLDNVTCSGNESSLTECQHSGFGSNGCEHGQDAAVICSAVSIILTGSGSTRCSGRVEVYHNNSWGTVCDDGWDLNDAEVVCRQLNCGSALEVPQSAHFGAGTGQIWLDNVTCSGNESSLTECQHSGFGSNTCEHGQDAAVICSDLVRLAGSGSSRCSGRVEVYHDNVWGTVSDNNWVLNDAEVVCREINCGSALEATPSSKFGAGSGQVWLSDVSCSGNESSLTECQHTAWGTYYNYYYSLHSYDVGVMCSGVIRLTGSGSTRCSGRVEVYHSNSWGTVCDDGWDLNDAEVVCRQINCGSALEVPQSAHFGAGTGQIWLDNVTCSGSESSLTECQHSGFGSNRCEHGQDAAVICSDLIRLAGSGSSRCSGRVEIFHNNVWGTVSDYKWDLNDAEVVCRQLNCGSALQAPRTAYFGAGTGQIWLSGVSCSGNESSLTECQNSGWGNSYYYYYFYSYYDRHYYDAGVICSGPIRLTGSGSSQCSGRVEVFHNNRWGTVCDDGWDLNDAGVVCRQLNCGSALEVPQSAHFGAGTGQIWLDNVTCSGNESSLTECQHSGFGSNGCEHGQDAAVICSAVSIILTGSGSTRCSGRVEVYHSNSWGTVCDDGWGLNDAEVVCRQLNCGSALEVPQSAHFGAGTGQIWLDHVTCSGSESSLTECQHSGFGSNTCEHGQDAAVICSDLIRLAGSGSSQCSGRVEVYHDNVWGTVSDYNWDLNDAEVVCRQLNCGTALVATPSSKFGAGSGQVWLSDVTCSGNESSLTECQHTGWGNYYNYYYSLHSYDVGVICSGVIRLNGSGSTRCAGRVEVYHSNSWGTVCDDGWDLNDAEVVCRQLDCGSALEVPQSAHFGAGTGQIWLDHVTCSGSESSLTECQHSGFGSNTCEHGQDAAVICSDLIRLAGSGLSRCSGRVEIFHNNIWGTVSDYNWDLNDAEVVCRQLNCGSALQAPRSAYFGAGTGQIWLSGVSCSGNESSLTECPNFGWGNYYNGHYSDAGVICSDQIRLAGSGSSRCSGRVEVYHNNSWGTVCDDGWDLNDAEVVCRQLNCGSALEVPPSAHFGAGSGQIWLDNVTCSGNESSLTECQHSGFGSNRCEHGQDATVICSGISPSPTKPPAPMDFDILLELHIPASSVAPDFSDVLRHIVRNVSLTQTITESLTLKNLTFTTWCYPNSTGGLQCRCEDQFAWSCDKCEVYGACSDVISPICGCIKGLPSNGEFCAPITDIAPCPPSTPVITPSTTSPTPTYTPMDFDIFLELHIPSSSVAPDFSDVLRHIVRNVSLTQTITESLTLKNLAFTTWCYPNSTGGLQCQCEDQFAWSCDKCEVYGACSDVISQTCGCIKGLPSNGEFCEPITDIAPCPSSTPVITPSTPETTATNAPVEFNIDLNLLFPISSLPPNFIDLFRGYVRNVSFPQNITGSLILEDLNFTTWCYPNSTGGPQCQCEDQFAWSCDKCGLYGACSNVTSHTCECIKGLPPGGEFCEPITNISPCPTTTPVITPSTPETTATNVTTPVTTIPTTIYVPVEFNIDLNLLFPISSLPPNFIDLFRGYVRNVSFPQNITGSLILEDLNFTTWCYPNSTGGLQCQCEDQFAWSCEKCGLYGACSNVTSHTCECIQGLPPGGEFCEPIANISPCPTTTPVITPSTSETTATNVPVEFNIDLNLLFPISSLPPNFIDLFRGYVRNVSFPQNITGSLILEDLNFTTWCYPNSTGGLQCQCEDQFAWSCEKCGLYGACSNVTSHTCECIQALPPGGEFCEPIANISPCPTTTPVITPSTSETTATNVPVEFNIDLNLLFPISSLPPNFIDLFRGYVRNVSFPQNITGSLILEDLNFTTWCYPNSTGGLQCQCEDQFAWSCEKCGLYGACSNVTSHTCECIQGLPPGGEFCEPIANISPCPTTTPVITPSTPETTATNVTTPVTTIPTTIYVTTPSTTSPTSTNAPVVFYIAVELHISAASVPPNITVVLRDIMKNVISPQIESLTVKDLNFTTWCYPNSTGGLQCQCEDQFAWSCENCGLYGACSNVTSQTCGCINRLPPGGEICQPISTFNPCITSTTTTLPSVTTTTMPITTTTPTMPFTPLPPPPTTTTSTTTPMTQTFEITLDVEFKEEYNQVTNDFHITVSNTIRAEGQKQGIEAKLIKFRSGSTIAQYQVSANSSVTPDFQALNLKIAGKLAESYPVVFEASGPLTFVPNDGFYEQTVTVTCGPPPVNLNFGTVSAAEWRRNTVLIAEDGEHRISVKDGISTLTVSRFISSDDGVYECRLMRTNDKAFFRQKSEKSFSLKTKPTITVSPIRQYVQCLGESVALNCSVSGGYEVEFRGFSGAGNSITYNYIAPQGCEQEEKTFTCQSITQPVFTKAITLQLSSQGAYCINDTFGQGDIGYKAAVPCYPKLVGPNKVGEITAVCKENKKFDDVEYNCILLPVQELLDQSQFLTATTLPVFLEQLKNVTVNYTDEVITSPPNIKAIVRILINVANKSLSLDISISRDSMENVLITAGVLTINGTKQTWNFLNNNDTRSILNNTDPESVSSSFLDSLETITSQLVNATFDITTDFIQLNRTTFTDTFNAEFNSSVTIEIPESNGDNKTITMIVFNSLDNVLPARDEANSSLNSINGRVVLVQSSGKIKNISFTFDILNDTLRNPECVFWNFSLFDGLGGWDGKGCELVLNINETGTVTCNCNHLTSFSILMSPNSPKKLYLDIITYIGVGISMGSLVICLIIEGLIWRKIRKNETSYLRHVAIVNIAVSLLIANIWFIIGAAISDAEVKNPPACTAATFFIHFFYLALFFWMLASAMLLLYRTTNVFGGGLSKASMLAIGFFLGYGAPLIIATVTIAATAPDNGYIRENTICWLNWDKSKALLAFVIPALSIVVINLIILVVVLYKIIRRRVGTTAAQAEEKHVLVVIAKSLAVLTPFFGITWGLGAGILADPTNEGIHIAFAFFNSLQGFFILVFGTLLDGKVRSAIASWSQPSRSRTGSTSAGNSTSSGFRFLRNWRRGRDGYNMTSSASSDLHSASNT
ncbi:uncharacterized protein LOC102078007 isoform X6 [Oreochromis niloticus]|uniref:uncharacterized protein LOC102078007 isoform X6 n=1 Tax=Oreochromis niloticus TaxID=8128 RepID=UPI000DF3ABA7|nr:uncharacterized protein LOC102078007 isoform X6 [Oreochromis niloticus]